jgi:hypothetical protein
MDDTQLLRLEEEERSTEESLVEEVVEKPSGKRQFNDTLLVQLMCPSPTTLPRGVARRVYGVMSDTPVSRRTRLYQS